MSAANRAFLVIKLTGVLALSLHPLATSAQGNFVDKFMVKGYDHAGSFGGAILSGQINPPSGTFEISQTTQKVGKPGQPGIVAIVDAVVFPSANSALEVFGIADANGIVTPTSNSFSTPGSADVQIEGIAVFYEYNPFMDWYEIVGGDVGTISIASTLSNPASVDNVRERSTLLIRDGLAKHTLSLKSDLHGRFGYGGAGTVSIRFDGTAKNLVVASPGTAVNTDDSRFGFVMAGSIVSQK